MSSSNLRENWKSSDLMYERSPIQVMKNKLQAEYIWIGGSGLDVRAKTRTLKAPIESVREIPEWNFDGSSTNQASGDNSEVWLRPIKFVPDPFRRRNNILVLCECLDAETMEPIESNRRGAARRVFDTKEVTTSRTWWGLEQEYTLFESDGVTPLGWPKRGFPAPQGPYYCGVGAAKAWGRSIVEAHYRACLYSGIDISGVNAEVMPGQWEFQVGPAEGIDASDQLWLARYMLERVAEQFNVIVSFDPKPIRGDWNGAGCHTNFSTEPMRKRGGYDVIIDAIGKLEERHMEHMAVYGKGNESRMSGLHETSSYDKFSYGVAHRGASIRIPRQTVTDQKGYFEDRRPASNCDPYDVTAIIAESAILYQKKRR